VRIHIRELVLEGIAFGDRHRVADALQSELSRLAMSRPAPTFAPSAENLDAGAFNVSRNVPLGAQVARQIFAGLKR